MHADGFPLGVEDGVAATAGLRQRDILNLRVVAIEQRTTEAEHDVSSGRVTDEDHSLGGVAEHGLERLRRCRPRAFVVNAELCELAEEHVRDGRRHLLCELVRRREEADAGVSTYLAHSHEKSAAVNLSNESVLGMQASVGAVARVSVATLAFEYNVARVSSRSIKLGVGF
jgi:hypothetical protein